MVSFSHGTTYAILFVALATAVLPSLNAIPACSAQAQQQQEQPSPVGGGRGAAANTIGTLVRCATSTTPPSASAQQLPGGMEILSSSFNNTAGGNNTTVTIKGEHTLTLVSTASAKVKPDEVTVTFKVHTEAKSAHDAVGNNTQIMGRVRQAITNAGVAENQTQTVDFRISPVYNYQISPPLLIGYGVDNSIRVKTPMVENITQIIDTATAAGANGITSVDFGISDPVRVKTETALIHNATQNARQQADALAKDLGVKVTDVLSISSQVSSLVGGIQQQRQPGALIDAFSLRENAGIAPSIQAPSGLSIEAKVFVTFVIEKA